jgi:2'-5' RNA ligase superfamily
MGKRVACGGVCHPVVRRLPASGTLPIDVMGPESGGLNADTVVWLAPQPAEPFIALTTLLQHAFPQLPRYRGWFGPDVIPHVTIGDRPRIEQLEEAARWHRRRAADMRPGRRCCTADRWRLGWVVARRPNAHIAMTPPASHGDRGAVRSELASEADRGSAPSVMCGSSEGS